MKKLTILVVTIILGCSTLFGQNIFQKHLGTFSGDDYIKKVIPTANGGFATTGYTTSFGKGGKDICLATFNASGDIQWSQTYGADGDEEAVSLIQTSDGGYLIVGHTRSNSFGENDIYIIKTNSTGDMIWNKTYGGTDKELAWDVMELAGQKYLLLCQTQSFSNGLLDICLLKINSSGVMEWAKSYGGFQNDWCYNMRKTIDGEYLLAGATYTYGSGKHDMLLMKVNEDGIISFCIVIGGSDDDYAYCANQDGYGNFLVGGKTSSPNSKQENVLIKLDNTLSPLWQKYFGASGEEVVMNILPTDENGYYLTGWSTSYGAGVRDVFLTNFNTQGNLNWLKAYGGADDDAVSQKSSVLMDERIVIGAVTKSFSMLTYRANQWDGYLIKTDMSGNSGCNEINYNPPATDANLSISDITSTIGVMTANFKTSTLGEDLIAGLEVVPLCFTGTGESNDHELAMRIENPFSDELHIHIPFTVSTESVLIIRDIVGRIVYTKKLSITDDYRISIVSENWEKGVYIVELHSAQGTTCIKTQKQ